MGKDSDEESLRSILQHCEKVIEDVEEGKRSSNSAQDDLHECISKLEDLTRKVSALHLFSDNESFEELPTSSLYFMLIPCYLAMATNSLIVDRAEMVKYKEMSKVYYRDFLERLSEYGVIGFKLPWVEERLGEESTATAKEPNATDRRIIKQKRYEQEAAMKKAREEYHYQLQRNSEDDHTLRSLMMVTLCLYAHKAMDALDFLDEEIKILEFMAKRETGHEKPRPPVKAKKLPTFIIAKSAEQKKVFGLGYPAIPTVTVDEWYDSMVASGQWANPTANRVVGAPEEKEPSDDESGDEADEQKRLKAQRWDEYKDDHRRDGEVNSSGDEGAPLPALAPQKDDEPKNKRSRCIWTDVALEQSLDIIGHKAHVPNSQECKIDRGAESYCAIKKPFRGEFIEDFDGQKSAHPRAVQPTEDLFGDVGDVEEFGVGQRNQAKVPTEYSDQTSRVSNKFRGRGRGGTAFRRRERSPVAHSSTPKNSSRDSSSSGRPRGGARGGLQTRGKRKHSAHGSRSNLSFMAEGYSIEKLVAAEFQMGMSPENLAEEACEALGEKKKEMIVQIINEIGEEKFHELFNKTRETELNGGMMTLNRDRRKTPGGVFMHYVRVDPTISQEFKTTIFGVDRPFKKAAKRNNPQSTVAVEQTLKSAAEVLLDVAPEEGELMDEN
ncbi:hypothetical protein QR680_013514 [Steinernema hermaphroditum]|uniref:Phosphorylated adapter RNA export protein RNA-binding domain-containing protein n=1 Tax=Steinernema hermaphroditum TaxID=289476 RepID=A0AA39M2H2_9BILA|nr:hypothetical protein QR680_013514 [Steinernema hermaphroditum]